MKKLINLLFISFVAFGIYAQEIVNPSSSTYYTFGRNPQRGDYSQWTFTGAATDLLIETTSDTIDVRFQVKKYRPYTIKTITEFDPILGADTTVAVQILGRNSENESYTTITSTTSSAVASDETITSLNSATSSTFAVSIASTVDTLINGTNTLTVDTSLIGYVDNSTLDSIPLQWTVTPSLDTSYITRAAQTITLAETATLCEYRYITVRYIISGDDATGTGIELKQLEIKLFEH